MRVQNPGYESHRGPWQRVRTLFKQQKVTQCWAQPWDTICFVFGSGCSDCCGLADCTQGMPGSQVGYQLIPWVILWLLYAPAFLCLSEGFSRTKNRRTLVHFITWVRTMYLLAMKTENKLEFN